jgi:hypothetical protein
MTASAPVSSREYRGRAGFTLVELLIYVVLSFTVLGAIYKLLVVEQRTYGKQRELLDVRESVRSAAALLTWELRHATIAGGNLLALGTNAVTLKSVQGVGIVCAKKGDAPRYALWRASGDFTATTDDSALVYALTANAWPAKALRVNQVGTPAALGVSTCSWPGARTPDIAVGLSNITVVTDTNDIQVGSPIRVFRKVEYGEFLDAGRWWLGRRVGPSGTWEKLTGPLMSPTDSGLRFRYYNSANAETAVLTAVVRVEVLLRGQSYKRNAGSGVVQFEVDSARTRVALRK